MSDTTKKLVIPTVHLNGTSRDELYNQVTEAGSAAYKLLEALSGMRPNGRDYYPQGPDALRQAEAENLSRIERVESIIAELVQLSEGIMDQ